MTLLKDANGTAGLTFTSLVDLVGAGMVSAQAESVLPGLGDRSTQFAAAAAKASAAGKILHFQATPQPYTINPTVIPPDTMILLDKGATIARSVGVTGSLITTSSAVNGLSIVGGQIDNASSTSRMVDLGTGPTDTYIKGVAFTSMGVSGEAIYVTESASNRPVNTIIEDCTFDGVGVNNQSTIFCANPDFLRVKNCKFTNVGAIGMTGTGVGENIYLGGNHFENVNATNMQCRTQGSGQLRGLVIEGNTSVQAGVPLGKGLCTAGEQVLGSAGSSLTKGVVIANNTVKYFNGVAISIGGGPFNGVIQDIAVVGNVIDASNLSDAYDVASAGINLLGVTGFEVTGNRIRQCGRGGIRLNDSHDGSVGLNTVDSCVQGVGLTAPTADDEHGIALFTACSNITIDGNVCKNNGTVLGTNGTAGIGCTANVGHKNITVSGNRCYDDRGGSAAQAFGLRIGTADTDGNQPTFWTVTGNDFSGNATWPIKLYNTTGKGHKILNNQGVDELQVVSTDAAFGLTAHINPRLTLFTAVMAAARAVTFSTTGAQAGDKFKITRTAASTGAFNLNVGTGPLKALATGTYCEVVYDGTAWALFRYGAL